MHQKILYDHAFKNIMYHLLSNMSTFWVKFFFPNKIQENDKEDLENPNQAHSHSNVIQEKFKRSITEELNDMCLESHQKVLKPRKKTLRPLDTID